MELMRDFIVRFIQQLTRILYITIHGRFVLKNLHIIGPIRPEQAARSGFPLYRYPDGLNTMLLTNQDQVKITIDLGILLFRIQCQQMKRDACKLYLHKKLILLIEGDDNANLAFILYLFMLMILMFLMVCTKTARNRYC